MRLHLLLALAGAATVGALPWGTQLGIHVGVLVSNAASCVPKNSDFSAENQKDIDIEPGECKNIHEMKAKSFMFRATNKPKKAGEKGCKVVVFEDGKCKKKIQMSLPVEEMGGWSICQNVFARADSMLLDCD